MKLRPRFLSPSAIIRFLTLTFFLGAVLAQSVICFARDTSSSNCISFADATKHLGTTQCITGTVLHVEDGGKGVKFLNFCKDRKACPFTVVVFPADLKKMGDVRQLEGRQIEVKGTIQDYDGRAEIILRRTQQLLGNAAFLLFPKVPTDYDVERQGHNRAGKMSHPKASKKTDSKQGDPMSIEDPGQPQ
jgi:DNA/RNA endonuclease YhcR with UshA esterase domain